MHENNVTVLLNVIGVQKSAAGSSDICTLNPDSWSIGTAVYRYGAPCGYGQGILHYLVRCAKIGPVASNLLRLSHPDVEESTGLCDRIHIIL